MKAWQKVKSIDQFGPTIMEWRHRDLGRFIGKIFSWLLGAFVFGILTSILFSSVGLADAAQPSARVVFFTVFAGGILSSYFRCLINGISYQINKSALVHVHPYFGWGNPYLEGAKNKILKPSLFAVEWTMVKEIQERPGGFKLLLDDMQQIYLPVAPTVKLSIHLNQSATEPRAKSPQKSDKSAYQKEVLRLVIKAARDAHRAAR